MDYMDKENKQENEKKEVSFAQKVGRFMGAAFFSVAAGCIMAILVALTAKLIFWII